MADVIEFRGRGTKRSPAETAQGNKAAGRTHVEVIKQFVEENSPRMVGMDQLRVAENMWKILEETERHGIKKARVLHQAGHGREEESTKRLPHYALNPSLTDQEKDGRARHLVKSASKYLSIAKEAGKFLGDEDRFVAKLFAGTSVTISNASEEVVGGSDGYTELAHLIREVARGIARKHDLVSVFRDVQEHRLRRNRQIWYDDDRPSFFSGDDDWATLWNNLADGARVVGIDGTQDQIIDPFPGSCDPDWVLPYPSLRLGWTVPASVIHGLDTSWTPSQLTVSHRDEGTDEVVQGNVTGIIAAEVRLAILPIGAGGAPEPAFITKLWTIVFLQRLPFLPDNADEHLVWPGLPSELGQYDPLFECSDFLGDLTIEPWSEHDGQEELCLSLRGKEPALGLGSDDSELGGVRIDLVSPQSCRDLLRFQDSDGPFGFSTIFKRSCGRSVPQMKTVEEDAEAPYDRLDSQWRTPDGTLARAVESHIFAVPLERRLDTLLDNECKRVTAEVSDFLQPIKAARQQARAEIVRQWQEVGDDDGQQT